MSRKKKLQSDSLVTFQNCSGVRASGTLLRLTRTLVVFEVYNPYSVVQSSEVLSNLRIMRGERAIYDGKAVVTNIVGTGLMLIVSASLVDAWSDLVDLKPGPALREEVHSFIAEWNESHGELEPAYKNSVTSIRNFLLELSRWLEHSETVAGLRGVNSADNLLNEFAADIESIAFPKLMDLFNGFEEVCKEIPRSIFGIHKAFAQRELHPLMLCSPYIYRTYTKPLGYAGDYQMVNMIIGEPLEGESSFSKVINALPLRVDSSQGHRNRIKRLTEMLENESMRAARSERPLRVLNIGCGPAIEIQRFIRESDLSNRVALTLVDFNEETLAFAKSSITNCISTHRRQCEVRYIHQSIHDLLADAKEGRSRFQERFDVIYCAGLFDYLSDLVCNTLIDLFMSMIEPNGLVLATNVHSNFPSKGFMAHLLEWNLILRDEIGMQQLGSVPARRNVYCDPTGTNIFLELRPLKSS